MQQITCQDTLKNSALSTVRSEAGKVLEHGRLLSDIWTSAQLMRLSYGKLPFVGHSHSMVPGGLEVMS
jgi:hypothetical protein